MNTLPVISMTAFGAAGGTLGQNAVAALFLMGGAILFGAALHLMAGSER